MSGRVLSNAIAINLISNGQMIAGVAVWGRGVYICLFTNW